jgi:hypothetical protein
MDVTEKKKIAQTVVSGDLHMNPPKSIIVDIPSNSHKSRMKAVEKEEPPKIEKIVSGTVTQRKKSIGKKIKEALIGDAATDVSSYVLYEVLIPGAKNIIYEVIMGGLEMRMWGEAKTTRSRLGNKLGKPIVNYGLYSVGKTINNAMREVDPVVRRPARDIGEIIFSDKAAAKDALDTMIEYIEEYGRCSVNVLYGMIGITGDSVDEDWGWTDLSNASIRPYRKDWVLNLPRPRALEK